MPNRKCSNGEASYPVFTDAVLHTQAIKSPFSRHLMTRQVHNSTFNEGLAVEADH